MGEVKNIPALRFPEFVGVWGKTRLGDVSNFISKGTTPKSFTDKGINFIKIESLNGIHVLKEKCLCIDEKTHYGELKRSILEDGDILFAIAGATVGKIGIVTKEILPANTNQALAIIRLKDKKTNPFLLQVLESRGMKKYIFQSMSVGAQPNLNLKQINDFEFKAPSTSEQTKIANFLTTVDERINLLSQQKEKLEQYKKGVMQQIFNQEIRFKDDDGNEFPKWEEKRLGEIGEIVSGLTYSPKDIDEKGTLVLRSSNIQNRSITFDDNVYVLTENYNPVRENDILICVRNGSQRLIGKNAIIKKSQEGMAFGAFMSVFRSAFNQFIFHFFDTDGYYRNVYRNLGATINSINGSELKEFKIPFPSLPEQQKIATFLSSIDKKIELVNQQIEQSKTWKKGLLQKMFV